MGNIVLLDDLTINKIAAGEVIERPASVIKEMVENSIDAGAKNITVEIKNGGISYIRISDDGKGIARDDVEMAFERHATSKIRSAADLQDVKSMGFRGEALASIAAIATVELVTKTEEEQIGTKIVVEGGDVLAIEDEGCSKGTSITVRNLFFNTPVRYKFLKKDYTESGYIEDVMTRIALVHPEIAIKLINSNKTILQTNGSGELKNVIYSIYGKQVTEEVLQVSSEYEDIKINGVIGKPAIARSNRSNQIFFVNKRYVKDKTLTAAAEQAFKGLIPIGKFGFIILNIDMNPNKVDVNVHPAKLEVRFENEDVIFKAMYHAVKDTLLKANLISDREKTREANVASKDAFKVQSSFARGITGLFKRKENEEEKDDNTDSLENEIPKGLRALSEEETLNSDLFGRNNSDINIEETNTQNILKDIYIKKQNEEKNKESEIQENINIELENEKNKSEEKNEEEIQEYVIDKSNEQEKVIPIVFEDNDSENKQEESENDEKATKNQENNKEFEEKESINDKIEDGDSKNTCENTETNLNKEILKNENTESKEKISFEEMYKQLFGKEPYGGRKETKSEPEDVYKIDKEIDNNNISMFENMEEYNKPIYKFIGIAFNTYIILEMDKELYIIDQHAAHERIMYEKVKKNFYSGNKNNSQLLLLPDIITLTHKEMGIAKDNFEMFEKAGFILEEFGENTIKLSGVPDICIDLDTKELFMETLDEINTVARTAKQEKEEKFIATVACKAAVKANMVLTKEEVDSLMNELLKLPNPFSCPHGRPTVIKMSKYDIERKFERK